MADCYKIYRSSRRYRDFNAGFTLVEVLVGMLIIGILSLAVSSLFETINRGVSRSKFSYTMYALEAALISALEDPETFKSAAADLEGNSLALLEIRWEGKTLARWEAGGDLDKNRVFFRGLDGEECASTLLPGCNIRVDFDIRNSNVAVPRWEVGYRISYVGLGTPMAPIGAPYSSPPNDQWEIENNDLLYILPDYFYTEIPETTCGSGQLLAGFDTINNRAQCWEGTYDGVCPANEIPKGLKYVKHAVPVIIPNGPEIIGTVEFKCVPSRTITCNDPWYGLTSFNPKYFDPGISIPAGESAGKCVFLGANIISLPVGFSPICQDPYLPHPTLVRTCIIDNTKQFKDATLTCPQGYVEDPAAVDPYLRCVLEDP